MKINEDAIWELSKAFFSYMKYLTHSKEARFEKNLRMVAERYWLQKLTERNPAILDVIRTNTEFRGYFSSRKKVKKLLSNRDERSSFKAWLEKQTVF